MWVARDEDNTLRMFRVKPFRLSEGIDKPTLGVWDTNDDTNYECILDSSLFPSLRWEDEPIEVELTEINSSKVGVYCPDCKFEGFMDEKDLIDEIFFICPDCGRKVCILE